MATDIQNLISEVAAKNRVLVDPDDPVFAVVTKNQLMPDEAVEELLTRVGIAISRFEPSDFPPPGVSKMTFDRRLQNRASGRATRAAEGLPPNEINQSRSRRNPESKQ